jgi:hypothetical protein
LVTVSDTTCGAQNCGDSTATGAGGGVTASADELEPFDSMEIDRS